MYIQHKIVIHTVSLNMGLVAPKSNAITNVPLLCIITVITS